MKNQVKNQIFNFILLLTVILFSANIQAQSSNLKWKWAVKAGGTYSDEGRSITVDALGNTYVTGRFDGTANFGNTTLSTIGADNGFIAKLDSSGQLIWAIRTDGKYGGMSIKLDAFNNIYITGFFQGTANFGNTTLKATGNNDVFVAKLNNDGQWQWAVNAGGNGGKIALGLTSDPIGNIYITGSFYDGAASFGSTTLISSGYTAVFVAKLNSSGQWQWAKKAGGNRRVSSQGIAVDIFGNTYITGNFTDTASFDTTILTSAGKEDIYISKLNSSGQWQWAKKAGGLGRDFGVSIITDMFGNIYLTGSITGIASFDSSVLTSIGRNDIFVAKVDSNGQWIWAKNAGSKNDDAGIGISVDAAANVFLTGSFNDTISFGNTKLTSLGTKDIFITKLNTKGQWQWAINTGGRSNGKGNDIKIGGSGNIYVTGGFDSTANFGSINITSAGSSDIFIARLKDEAFTGIEENNQKVTVKIYPNPATNQLTIETSNIINSPITITDITGRQVIEKLVNSNQVSLDISTLPNGLYFVNINNSTYKFIKQ